MLHKKSNKLVEKYLNDAAQRLILHTIAENPGNIEVTDKDTLIAKVGVTVDGTWQKRGHYSKMCVVFVISIDTGEVLDYNVRSLFCHECTSNYARKSKDDFDNWYNQHKIHCQINHTGSADKMESEGAKSIFLRSLEKGLKYITFIGDGGSSSFEVVAEACKTTYGDDYIVIKEECQGHIQKRMGHALRGLKKRHQGQKLSNGKTFDRKDRMTDNITDKIQNYYGYAIRNNSGDKKTMQNSIWAIFFHTIRDNTKSLEEQYSFCPRDSNSWCKFWSDRENYKDSKRLPPVFIDIVKSIFTRLSEDELLGRCLKGYTQNQNESINGMLWNKCTKTRFCGKRKLELSVAETVMEFNTGVGCKAKILESLGLDPGQATITFLEKKDAHRIKTSEKKISIATRLQRQKLRSLKKSKTKTPISYVPGGFGLETKPDKLQKKKIKVTKKTRTLKKLKNVVGCWYTIENLVPMPAVINEDILLTFILENISSNE